MGGCGALLLGAVLAAWAARAGRGADDGGFGACGGCFYSGTPPSLRAPDGLRLCQRSEGAPRLATLYSPGLRAPLYSALRAPAPPAPPGPRPAPRWLLHPKVDDPDSELEDGLEESQAVAMVPGLGTRQALSADYLGSEYERGQLWPLSLGSADGPDTWALTNAVPMRPWLRRRWHANLLGLLERALRPQCQPEDRLFLLAGAVPSGDTLHGRVALPAFLWLAACCAAPGGGWAMGFVQQPREDAVIEDLMLRDLEALLPSRPQLFQSHCAESEQDTERMKSILEVVNQLQAEDRAAQAQPRPPPSEAEEAAPQPPGEAEEAPEEAAPPRKPLGPLGVLVKLLRLLWGLALGVLRATLQLLDFLCWQALGCVRGCLCRLGAFLLAIGGELLAVPWQALRVLGGVGRALLRVLCCLLKAVCRLLALPLRVLLDVAAFPLHTLGAVPLVCRDIALGLGGTLGLLLDAALGTAGGLCQLLFSVCRRFCFRAAAATAADGSGEF